MGRWGKKSRKVVGANEESAKNGNGRGGNNAEDMGRHSVRRLRAKSEGYDSRKGGVWAEEETPRSLDDGSFSLMTCATSVSNAVSRACSYSVGFVGASTCPICGESFDNNEHKKTRCANCGGAYCAQCASNGRYTDSVASAFGKRHAKHAMLVKMCDECAPNFPTALEEYDDDELEVGDDEVNAFLKQKSRRAVEDDEDAGIFGDDEEALFLEDEEASVKVPEVHERAKLVRKMTLDRYAEVVLEQEELDEVIESGFKRREEESKRKMTQANQKDPNKAASRIKRAQTLKSKFFEELLNEPDPDSKDASRRTRLMKDPSSYWDRGPLVERKDVEEEDVGLSDIELDYLALEKELEESLKGLKSLRKDLSETEKAGLKRDNARIAELRNELVTFQSARLTKGNEESKQLIGKLKEHASKLEKLIQEKLEEEYDEDENEDGRQSSAGRRGNSSILSGLFSSRSKASRQNSAVRQPTNAKLQEDSHVAEMAFLRTELDKTLKALKDLRVEKHFPRCMQWKLRVDAGENLYIGMRDLEIETLQAKFIAQTGPKGTLSLRVYDIKAIIGILQFAIRGNTTKARLLSGLLTPTINRLDLVVEGEWLLSLMYKGGDSKNQQPRWEEDPRRSSFSLHIQKTVTGLTTMRLPSAIVKLLTNSLIPRLISSALRELLPTKLNTELGSDADDALPFLAKPDTQIEVEGMIDISGEMSPYVWRAPIIGPTKKAEQARRFLGLQSVEEAVTLDYMCRGPRASAAGFHRKAISLARLYKWRLQYASHPLERLEEIMSIIQNDANVKLPRNWFSQLMYRVAKLSAKPVDFDVKITGVHIDIDLIQGMKTVTQLYLDNVENTRLAKAKSDKARAAARKEIAQSEQNVRNLMDAILTITNALNESVALLFNIIVLGGQGGLIGTSLDDVVADMKLPSAFSFRQIAEATSRRSVFEISGKQGPGSDEYTLTFKNSEEEESPGVPVVDDDEDENEEVDETSGGSDIILANTKIELFPPDAGPGAVRLSASRIRGSVLLPLLDDAIANSMQQEFEEDEEANDAGDMDSLQLLRAQINPLTKNLMEQTRQLLEYLNTDNALEADTSSVPLSSRSRAPTNITENNEGEGNSENPFEVLPDILALNDAEFAFDLRGLHLNFKKTPNRKLQPTLNLTATYEGDRYYDKEVAILHLRRDMQSVFDDLI